ncbi:2TM domain-containing protein [Herbaspirillum frisingense]|uniref:2TM domain-containing protein n=1 Tax=Herbaspirillum frisingense TaxID=92645 RepID=UPI0039B02482
MRDTELYNDTTHPDYLCAERRVARQLGFFRHLAIYLVVNAGLMLANLLTPHPHWWSIGPLLGWGIGVLFHALSVFGRFPADWNKAMIARELRRR